MIGSFNTTSPPPDLSRPAPRIAISSVEPMSKVMLICITALDSLLIKPREYTDLAVEVLVEDWKSFTLDLLVDQEYSRVNTVRMARKLWHSTDLALRTKKQMALISLPL